MQQNVSRRKFVRSTVAGTAAVTVAGCAQTQSEGTADGNSTLTDGNETSTEEESAVPEDASVSLSVPIADELSGLYSPCIAFFEAENFTVDSRNPGKDIVVAHAGSRQLPRSRLSSDQYSRRRSHRRSPRRTHS